MLKLSCAGGGCNSVGEREYVYAIIQPGWKVKGGTYTDNLWRVLRVAVVTPLSTDRVLRDMSVLKSFLISGQVGKTREGASSCFLGQGLWLSQIPPAGAGKA